MRQHEQADIPDLTQSEPGKRLLKHLHLLSVSGSRDFESSPHGCLAGVF
jgi:hypothetical protein